MQIWEGLKHHFIPSEHNAYRPKILHRSWLLFFLALVLASEGFLVANLVARQGDQNFLAAVVPAEVIALTNDERAQNDVGQLSTSALLTEAAQAKADDMAKNGYFSHIGPDGKTPWQWISAAGYQYQYAGENLAVRFVNSSDVVNAWMASPTHRDNIVKPVYTQIGVGVTQGLFEGQTATYVVQFFGTPLATNQTQPAAVAAAPISPAPQATAPEVSANTASEAPTSQVGAGRSRGRDRNAARAARRLPHSIIGPASVASARRPRACDQLDTRRRRRGAHHRPFADLLHAHPNPAYAYACASGGRRPVRALVFAPQHASRGDGRLHRD